MFPKNIWPGRSPAVLASAGFLLLSALPAWPGSGASGGQAAGGVPTQETAAPHAEPDPGIISRGSPVQSGPVPDLLVLYAGEVMGWTEPCG